MMVILLRFRDLHVVWLIHNLTCSSFEGKWAKWSSEEWNSEENRRVTVSELHLKYQGCSLGAKEVVQGGKQPRAERSPAADPASLTPARCAAASVRSLF